ncbi:DNA protecting protein DprA [Synergistales bacterium]|nr:DNA protecting protein DprA [Synergistales bacterium]
MDISENSMATILLCGHLGIVDSSIKPYTTNEWNTLVKQLMSSSLKEPRALIGMDSYKICNSLNIQHEEADRICVLLSRSANVAFLLEGLDQKGIHAITRSEKKYPVRLHKMLQDKAPAVLYYCGNLELANQRGVAIVGSRNIDEEGMDFAKKIAKKAVSEGYAIYSGGARGVDQISEETALDYGGYCVSFLSDSMTKKIRSSNVRTAICDEKLLLLSAVNPDVPFSIGNAMARNKYVYAMAKCAFVVASDHKKGGTWEGAQYSIDKKLVPTYVWDNPKYLGNKHLISLGGLPVTDAEQISIKDLLTKNIVAAKPSVTEGQLTLFGDNIPTSQPLPEQEPEIQNSPDKDSVYDAILPIILSYLSEPKTPDEISKRFSLVKSQTMNWLKRAVEEKKVRRTKPPIKYFL